MLKRVVWQEWYRTEWATQGDERKGGASSYLWKFPMKLQKKRTEREWTEENEREKREKIRWEAMKN